MKAMLVAFLGVFVAWGIIGLITQNYESNMLIGIFIGAVLGYSVRKETEKKNDNMSLD